MNRITVKELSEYMEDISDSHAFELAAIGEDFVVPYIMNDSIEDYFIFKHCSIRGEYDPDLKKTTVVEAIEDGELTGLIIRQNSTNIVTLWFHEVFHVQKSSRYHEIGHFWIRESEHWRRIAYMAGTLYDKFTYCGEEFCNEKEMALLPLIEFAPLREFTVSGALDERYPDTYRAIDLMRTFAREVEDWSFLWTLNAYRRSPSFWAVKEIAEKMNAPRRAPLYELILTRLSEASAEHPPRDYGEERNAEIAAKREAVTNKLLSAGYSGTYPLFTRDRRQVLAAEEHPFALSEMEYEDFKFRIRFMVSECRKPPKHLCQGFFRRFGSKGYIEENIEKLI